MRLLHVAAFFAVIVLAAVTCSFADTTPPYLIGTGIYDITGPPAVVQFAGMVDTAQKGEGLLMRLRSRAFIVKDSRNGKSIVLVSAELGMMSQVIQLAVVEKLREIFGGQYTEENVALSATHTHSGPGGYFDSWMMSAGMGLGFCEANFQTIVDGIVESVKRAHNNLVPGTLEVGAGLSSAQPGGRYGRNRSEAAYFLNPEDEVDAYKTDDGDYDLTNRRMTIVRFERDNGTGVGMYAWAAVHPHASGQYRKLINGDSKGYASYLFEQDRRTDYLADETFAAAFVMNDAGDSSSNLPEDADDYADVERNELGDYPADGTHDYERMIKRGRAQYELARRLYDNAGAELTGSVDFRQMYVNFPGFRIDPDYVVPEQVRYHGPAGVDEDREDCRLCEPAASLAMMSGSVEDSVGPISNEGHAREVNAKPSLRDFVTQPFDSGLFDMLWGLVIPAALMQEDRDCHLEKIISLPLGRVDLLVPRRKTVAEVLPIQLFRIGRLAIVSLPFEVTTMAGRRIRNDIKQLMPDVTHVEINALCNASVGYLTTREEYALQHYEGGQNWFGPYTLNGVRQMLSELAAAMETGGALPGYALTIDAIERIPTDLKQPVGTVSYDAVPPGRQFGDIIQAPAEFYRHGDTVEAVFRGAHPNNNFQTQATYLAVERMDAGGWETLFRDWDPSTRFRWKQIGSHMSQVTIQWTIPADAVAGEYRIRHFGHWKSAVTGEMTSYEGVSSSFIVEK
ncbi:MAG: neutral/alkaline ceramidase [Deltaproteobacteria bacterium]|nr:neutral/alkaline ceramidase [Deltaproteobacteria bacterium]